MMPAVSALANIGFDKLTHVILDSRLTKGHGMIGGVLLNELCGDQLVGQRLVVVRKRSLSLKRRDRVKDAEVVVCRCN